MNEQGLGGVTKGYMKPPSIRESPAPEGWVKTLRPCPECRASFTYIDGHKVWHCQACGWRSDHMNTKNYTDKDIETIKKMRDLGKTAKQIGAVIGRSPASVSVKISELRKKGAIPKPEKAARYDGYQPKDDHAESVTSPQGGTGEVNPEKPEKPEKIEEIEQKNSDFAQDALSREEIAKIVHEEFEKGFQGMIKAKEPHYENMTLGQLIDLAAQCDFKLFKSEYVFPEPHQGGDPAGFYITFFLSTQGR